MRQWHVNPRVMCNQHLLGEHVEHHMFLGTIQKNKSLQGYVDDELIDTSTLKARHDALAVEMVNRGMNHKSPFPYEDTLNIGYVNSERSLGELARRCPDCRKLILERYGSIPDVNDLTFKRKSKRPLKQAA